MPYPSLKVSDETIRELRALADRLGLDTPHEVIRFLIDGHGDRPTDRPTDRKKVGANVTSTARGEGTT